RREGQGESRHRPAIATRRDRMDAARLRGRRRARRRAIGHPASGSGEADSPTDGRSRPPGAGAEDAALRVLFGRVQRVVWRRARRIVPVLAALARATPACRLSSPAPWSLANASCGTDADLVADAAQMRIPDLPIPYI